MTDLQIAPPTDWPTTRPGTLNPNARVPNWTAVVSIPSGSLNGGGHFFRAHDHACSLPTLHSGTQGEG